MAVGLRKRGKYFHMYAKVRGRYYQKSSRMTKLQDAIVVRDKWLTKLRGQPRVLEAPLFSELCDIWADRVGQHQKAWHKSTKHSLEILREAFKDVYAHNITAETIRKWRSKRGVSTVTQNRYTTLIFSIFRHAAEWGLVDEHQFREIKRVKLHRENNQRVRYLTSSEEKRLLKACDEVLKPVVHLAILTGMRRGEIFALRWSAIDLRNSVVRLPDSKSGKPRIVYLCKKAKEILKKRKGCIGPLFPYGNNWLHKRFRKAVEKAKLDDFRFHDLRHHFASMLAKKGISDRKLAALLGHSSTQMVQRYAHLSEQDLKNVVGLLDA